MPIQDIADDQISNYDSLALAFNLDEDMPIQDIADDQISNDDSLVLWPGQNSFHTDEDKRLPRYYQRVSGEVDILGMNRAAWEWKLIRRREVDQHRPTFMVRIFFFKAGLQVSQISSAR